MKKIGRKIYFDKETGNIILDTGEQMGSVVETTLQQDFESYKVLSERNPETIDVIYLPYGAFSGDFAECSGYRVNLQTMELEFSYPDPNDPESPQEFIKPLSQEVEELKQRQQFTEDALLEIILGGM
ncbi:hypothetical protein AWH56_005170 [Anaerobacillus isosaccharinicus]|uniref:Uncharacterized protein n=1 Tax=Anaerobacillus isosaccharinicus TaxID=1532552 RepID=A0A1S2L936_9BACI|nr:hypothetical protein [Anaerobacillus isosaccharinicus]MBA5584583.1 hypothetical protein [Anaerobacillus isosaccharinicus]QOY37037.1 hypothetical protein AWH56_005170 [Anaerobacillus isosaccharinicus]